MKRLFLLIDGTWNSVIKGGNKNVTNVYRMSQAIASKDKSDRAQMVFYFPGVGTRGILDKWVGGIYAEGLEELILEAYVNLVANFQDGDHIHIIGFSRGAFAAQVLSQLISSFGILSIEYSHHVNRIWAAYIKSKLDLDDIQIIRNINKYTRKENTIEFVGLFDSVIAKNPKEKKNLDNSVLNDQKLPDSVKKGFQILAIDERRMAYEPILWEGRKSSIKQKLNQIWMPGVHSDIGGFNGGSTLSDWSLFLMIDELRKTGRLEFNEDIIDQWKAKKHDEIEIATEDIKMKLVMRHWNRNIGSTNPGGCEKYLAVCKDMNNTVIQHNGKRVEYNFPLQSLRKYYISRLDNYFSDRLDEFDIPDKTN